MGRYKALRSFGERLLKDEPFNKILLRVQEKKTVTRGEAEHIMERMALRSYLRTEDISREEVWKIYAYQQVHRQRMHFLNQCRYKYMNVLFSGTIYPLIELPPAPFPGVASPVSPVVQAQKDVKWINLSTEDIRSSRFGDEMEGKPLPVKKETVTPDVQATCCYTCSGFLTKDSAWGACHLVSSPNGGYCNEKFNLRIVCPRCHLEMGTKTAADYVMGRGSYRCAKGLAVKEYVVTLGRALIIYYDLYRGIKHEN